MLTVTPNSCKSKGRRKVRFALYLFILLNAPFWQGKAAAKEELGTIPADVLCVVDGDTLKVRANVWIKQNIETNVRISGIDTPELKGKCEKERKDAIKAKNRVLSLLKMNPKKNICNEQGKAKVFLKKIKNDKYGGRTIAKIETMDGTDIATVLLEENLAVPYQGKKKKNFCKTDLAGK